MKLIQTIIIACGVILLILASPWIFGLGLLTKDLALERIDAWRYPKTNVFDASRWAKPDLKYRYSVVEEVVTNRIKPGMPQAEVRQLLGPPDSSGAEGWEYKTEPRAGVSFLDASGGGVGISFTPDQKVESVEDSRWSD